MAFEQRAHGSKSVENGIGGDNGHQGRVYLLHKETSVCHAPSTDLNKSNIGRPTSIHPFGQTPAGAESRLSGGSPDHCL
jgi:hypothetical protein